MSTELPHCTRKLIERFPKQIIDHHVAHGDETVILKREGMLDVFSHLRNDEKLRFDFMVDLTAVDYLPREPRFEVVCHLKSLHFGHRLRVRIPLEEAHAEVDSIRPLWIAADWYERECAEMYGIHFTGHPNLKPLLLYEGFQGYPLRKDYEKGLAQPLVELRPVQERYDYGDRFTDTLVQEPPVHQQERS